MQSSKHSEGREHSIFYLNKRDTNKQYVTKWAALYWLSGWTVCGNESSLSRQSSELLQHAPCKSSHMNRRVQLWLTIIAPSFFISNTWATNYNKTSTNVSTIIHVTNMSLHSVILSHFYNSFYKSDISCSQASKQALITKRKSINIDKHHQTVYFNGIFAKR